MLVEIFASEENNMKQVKESLSNLLLFTNTQSNKDISTANLLTIRINFPNSVVREGRLSHRHSIAKEME